MRYPAAERRHPRRPRPGRRDQATRLQGIRPASPPLPAALPGPARHRPRTAEDAAALAAITAKIPRITVISPATGKETLETWLEAAENSGIPKLASFAAGIRLDYDAVRNGLSLPWNSGAVEGTVCKIKKIKRQVYGLASFPLLRKLLLAANQPT